ncbi:MAG TPA: HEAT repeat domain-containing protein [Bryobacteraceae bacterium]|nr:HEAT repeat domain-containing protein [Bryobacteraceae bacterium]
MRGRIAGILFLYTVIAAGQPRFVGGKPEIRPTGSNLEGTFRAFVAQTSGPAWIGYAVPAVPGEHNMCCDTSSDTSVGYRGCGLEPGSRPQEAVPYGGPVRLEADQEFHVLFRVEQNQITRIRTFSSDCELDASGTQVVWLTAVKPAENVALLASFVAPAAADRASERKQDAAVSGIALTADRSADTQLARFLATGQPESLRRKAAFWIGAARRIQSLPALSQVALQDSSDKVRESAVHGLTLSRDPAALETVIGIAKNDKSPHVRGNALFWMANQAAAKASAAIGNAIENDPETKVKEQAVFALSRLPKDESIPALIQIARTNKNPAVKKKAMFWLGQSKDPRAIAFFEEVLTRRP